MFSTSILDVAVGVVFTFLAVSVVASAVTEAIAAKQAWRQTMLLDGIKALLNADASKQGAQYVLDLYNSALISHFGTGEAKELAAIKALPAYIEPKAFATALISLVRAPHAADMPIAAAIDTIENEQIRSALKALNNRMDGDLEHLHDAVANWFGAAMDRLSGRYKRKTQVATFIIAFIVAMALNADALRITRSIWQQKASADTVRALALDKDALAACDHENDGDCSHRRVGAMVDMLDAGGGLIGWGAADRALVSTKSLPALAGAWAMMLLGVLVSAGAALFGAPFWFDALQSIVQVRSTGPTPRDSPR